MFGVRVGFCCAVFWVWCVRCFGCACKVGLLRVFLVLDRWVVCVNCVGSCMVVLVGVCDGWVFGFVGFWFPALEFGFAVGFWVLFLVVLHGFRRLGFDGCG